ncbi:MAG: hypothetical protein K8S99_06055 [Planctomycetes bacterium]|nr:hypothetical protein [Planctomycetota bacterium]
MSSQTTRARAAVWMVSILLAWFTASEFAFAGSAIDDPVEHALTKRAIDADPQTAAGAIAQLRSLGPHGLEILLSDHKQTLKQYPGLRPIEPGLRMDSSQATATPEDLDRLRAAINAVAGQYDAWASRLYWYNDWSAASAESRRTGRPVLSLRMLGKLTDDRSCANSRFFRTVLYSNTALADYLRNNFVLHWESLRPVPQITIDFGDGRKIERTITGNSIHYVMTADGRVIDALPGVYGPKAFRQRLEAALAAAPSAGYDGKKSAQPTGANLYYTAAAADVDRRYAFDLAVITGRPAAAPAKGYPSAQDASSYAVVKNDVEAPMVSAVDAAPAPSNLDDATWSKLAELHRGDARLDGASRQFMSIKVTGSAQDAMRRAMSKAAVEDPLMGVVRQLEINMARDTVVNEYRFRRAILGWLAADPALAMDVKKLNDRVYTELFLTPPGDPWLGLVPEDAYSALDKQGLAQSPPTPGGTAASAARVRAPE